MKIFLSRMLFLFLIVGMLFSTSSELFAQENEGGNVLNDSLQDIYVVLGAGVGGAILGLSTLSFADVPKDHLKNIAIGGAVGIVVGVGIVIFEQANRSQSSIAMREVKEWTPEAFERTARSEFSKERIAANYFKPPTMSFNFSF